MFWVLRNIDREDLKHWIRSLDNENMLKMLHILFHTMTSFEIKDDPASARVSETMFSLIFLFFVKFKAFSGQNFVDKTWRRARTRAGEMESSKLWNMRNKGRSDIHTGSTFFWCDCILWSIYVCNWSCRQYNRSCNWSQKCTVSYFANDLSNYCKWTFLFLES